VARRLSVFAVVVLVVSALLVGRSASSQDNYEARIASLETEVALMRSELTALQLRVYTGGTTGQQATHPPTATATVVVPTPTATATQLPSAYDLEGYVSFTGRPGVEVYGSADGCYGAGRYTTLRVGAEVRVADAGGATLGTGKLGLGEAPWWDDESNRVMCSLPFAVPDVPWNDEYYFTVDGISGGWVATYEEMVGFRWQIELIVDGLDVQSG
jgi:hypothetical protein